MPMAGAEAWAKELLQKSPTALKFLKYSFNADSAYIGGITHMAIGALELYYQTDEALEGVNAFMERRLADFSKFRKSGRLSLVARPATKVMLRVWSLREKTCC
jgi:1,4-dihydroxy-2-naphthoyl-CoA synthase